MKRCSNCFIPVTKPGVELNEEKICLGCYHDSQKADIDYTKREQKLQLLCDKYRKEDGGYDCIIPVSGGKDSTYQTQLLVEEYDMNPLLVAVTDPFTHTTAGEQNLENLQKTFDCDLITVSIGTETTRKMMKLAFEEFGSPTWPIDRAIYCVPIQMGIKFDIPFIVYGENTAWEYGGVLYDHDDKEPYSALDQVKNDVAKEIDFDLWLENGISESDLNLMQYPTVEEIEEVGLEPIYLSYFEPWDGHRNYLISKKYGFKTIRNEWDRDGYIESYDQIDSVGYLMNVWMKYPKMGYMRTTDVVGYRRRSDEFDISIEESIGLIKKHDHRLDERILEDFLNFTGYSVQEFWRIVESHKNEEIFDDSFLGTSSPRPTNDFENLDVNSGLEIELV